MSLKIIEEGLQTTMQDTGRHGFQALGFSVSGAMDPWAMQLANLVVGNKPGEAVLEMSYMGPTIVFETDTVICLTGADMSPRIDSRPLVQGRPVPVAKGETLNLRAAKSGLYGYLAIEGGFQVPDILNSKSASVKDPLGTGWSGKLKAGDQLPIRRSSRREPADWQLSRQLFAYLQEETVTIRYLEGRQYHWFGSEALDTFTGSTYKSTPQSNRMGCRLSGPAVKLEHPREMMTEAAQRGTIQIPPDGQPIVLTAESQPTGGYPKIGQVIQSDIPKLGQLRPNQPVRFEKCSLETGYRALTAQQQELQFIQASVQLKRREYSNVHSES